MRLPSCLHVRDDEMARYEQPMFSKKAVNAAGKLLIKEPLNEDDFWAYSEALGVINNWRSIHGQPLNTFQDDP